MNSDEFPNPYVGILLMMTKIFRSFLTWLGLIYLIEIGSLEAASKTINVYPLFTFGMAAFLTVLDILGERFWNGRKKQIGQG